MGILAAVIEEVDTEHVALEDIEFEARFGAELALHAPAVPSAVLDEHIEVLRGRGLTRSGHHAAYYERMPPAARRRLDTMAYLEDQLLGAEGDYTQLVFLACQLLEGELKRMLEALSVRAGSMLLESVKVQGNRGGVLWRWLDQELPTTLGTMHAVLIAWRRALGQRPEQATAFLSERFEARYIELLATRGFERSLGNVRCLYKEMVRGLRPLEMEDMEIVACVILGCTSFGDWISEGPPEPTPSDVGILHHHLAHFRLADPEG